MRFFYFLLLFTFFPFVGYLDLFIPFTSLNACFPSGNCRELFNSCSIFFLSVYSILCFLCQLFCLSSFLLIFTTHSAILLSLSPREGCVWTPSRSYTVPGHGLGRSMPQWLALGYNRFRYFPRKHSRQLVTGNEDSLLCHSARLNRMWVHCECSFQLPPCFAWRSSGQDKGNIFVIKNKCIQFFEIFMLTAARVPFKWRKSLHTASYILYTHTHTSREW